MSVPLFDAVSGQTRGASGAATWTHTSSGVNRGIWVIVEKRFDTAPTIVTYNGVTCNLVDSSIGDNLVGIWVYELIGQATGANTVSVTQSGSHSMVCHSVSMTNVDQLTPHGTPAKNKETSQAFSTCSPASSTNDLILIGGCARNDTLPGTRAINVGASETDRRNAEFHSGSGTNGVVGLVATKAGAAGSTTVTETAAAGDTGVNVLALAIHGVASGATGLAVVSNTIKNLGSTAASASWASQADGKAHIKIATLPAAGERMSIVVRAASGGVQTSYRLDLGNAGGVITLKLVKIIATAETVLSTSAARTWATGERVGIIVQGASLKGYVLPAGGVPGTDTWTELVTSSDSAITASGKWGLEFVGSTAVGDDWYYASTAGTTVVGRSSSYKYALKNVVWNTRLLSFTISLVRVGSSRRINYILKQRIPAIRRLPFLIGGGVVVTDPGVTVVERCGSVTQELYDALGPLAYADVQNGYALWWLCCTVGGMLQPIDDLIRDTEGFAGWGQVMDLPTTPSDALDWLGQFVGVQPVAGLTDDQKIQRIASHEGFQRGTLGAIRSAGTLFLTGNKTVSIFERDSSAYHFTISTIPSETPFPNLTLQALLAQKPAGIQMTYTNFTGQTWAKLKADFATWTAVKANYANWDGVKKDIP